MEPNQEPVQSIQPVEQKQKNSWKIPLTIAVIALIAAALAGGVTWYLMNQSQTSLKTDNDKSVAALQKQINDLKKTQTITTTSSMSATKDWHTYKNTDYGFQLTFGDKWSGYTVKNLGVTGKSIAEYTFSLPTSDASYTKYDNNPAQVFNIAIYNTADYQYLVDSAKQNGGPTPALIMSKNGKSFTYSSASQWPSDWKLNGGTNGDVQIVISTFKFY